MQVQLPSYFFTKNFLVDNGYLSATSPLTYLASSSVSGIAVCVSRPPPTPSARSRATPLTRSLLVTPPDCHAGLSSLHWPIHLSHALTIDSSFSPPTPRSRESTTVGRPDFALTGKQR